MSVPAHQCVCGGSNVAGAAAPVEESQHQAIREPANQVPIPCPDELREIVEENLHSQTCFDKPFAIRMGTAFGSTLHAALCFGVPAAPEEQDVTWDGDAYDHKAFETSATAGCCTMRASLRATLATSSI